MHYFALYILIKKVRVKLVKINLIKEKIEGINALFFSFYQVVDIKQITRYNQIICSVIKKQLIYIIKH